MADSPITREAVESALTEVHDPETGRGLGKMGQIRDIRFDGGRIDFTIGLTTWSSLLWEETRQEVERILRAKFPSATQINVHVVEHSRPPERIGEVGLM